MVNIMNNTNVIIAHAYSQLPIVLELAQGGELFDFIANSGAFGEGDARYYFR